MGRADEIWERMSNFIPQFIVDALFIRIAIEFYPC